LVLACAANIPKRFLLTRHINPEMIQAVSFLEIRRLD